jgi:hypothetical protein
MPVGCGAGGFAGFEAFGSFGAFVALLVAAGFAAGAGVVLSAARARGHAAARAIVAAITMDANTGIGFTRMTQRFLS